MAIQFDTPSDATAKGSQGELIACAWLLGLGYHVFKNVSSSGPADLAVWHSGTGEFHLIDVKMTTRAGIYRKADGTLTFMVRCSGCAGVQFLIIADGDVVGFLRRSDGNVEWHWPLACPKPPLVQNLDERAGRDAAFLRRSRAGPQSASCEPSKAVKDAWR